MWHEKEAYEHHYYGYEEHQEGDAVHAVHVLDPLVAWLVGVSFFDVEVFRYLSPKTHGGFFCKNNDCCAV